MTDHTPTTEEVRDEWAYGNQEVDHDGNPVITLDEAFAQFDRWLSDLKREIAAEALREAAETFARTVGEPAHPGRSVVCLDMKTGVVTDVQTWLRDRADRIEQGGES